MKKLMFALAAALPLFAPNALCENLQADADDQKEVERLLASIQAQRRAREMYDETNSVVNVTRGEFEALKREVNALRGIGYALANFTREDINTNDAFRAKALKTLRKSMIKLMHVRGENIRNVKGWANLQISTNGVSKAPKTIRK